MPTSPVASAAEKVANKATGTTEANIGGVKASAEELRGKAKGKAEEVKGAWPRDYGVDQQEENASYIAEE